MKDLFFSFAHIRCIIFLFVGMTFSGSTNFLGLPILPDFNLLLGTFSCFQILLFWEGEVLNGPTEFVYEVRAIGTRPINCIAPEVLSFAIPTLTNAFGVGFNKDLVSRRRSSPSETAFSEAVSSSLSYGEKGCPLPYLLRFCRLGRPNYLDLPSFYP